MLITKPDYFDHFQCIAGDCPDSCCKEWDVQVDAVSVAMYRSLSGPLGDRLREVLKDEDGETPLHAAADEEDRESDKTRQDLVKVVKLLI